jgi:type III restriction enzyme
MFKPKPYQEDTIEKITGFLESARFEGPKVAFDSTARIVPDPWSRMSYVPLRNLADAPFVCLRLPTGGGKTFLATQCVKVGAKFMGREHNPLVLWLVPTDTIRKQTLETLQKPTHPNRETLEADFGSKLRILDIGDFIDLTPQDLRDKACVVISTFAALRVGDTKTRLFYDHNENLEPHFAAIPPNIPGLEVHTEGPDKGKIKKSCANIMALIRPLVIVDEAHNNKTKLSYDVLQRVKAGCVIEFTATPAGDSNVLHHVSASILKSEYMIKLPIMLTERPSWKEALTDSILTRKKLKELARNEQDYVRPIVLIQAESRDREVTVEIVEKYLVEHGKIERDRIAIATGSQRELDEVNLLDPKCKIEFVITVEALKEGWDCPFAYVFCSVATVHSPKDVEQLLGRVLRMPWAKKRTEEDLNRAYAFVSKNCWPEAVNQLHDRLVSMGFDEVEAAEYVKQEETRLPLFPEESAPPPLIWILRDPPALDGLSYEIQSQVCVVRDESGTYEVSIKGDLSPEAEAKIVAALPEAQRNEALRSLAARRAGIVTPVALHPKVHPMQIPQLCLWVDGELEPAQDEHFLSPDSWNLLNYPIELTEEEFCVEERADTWLIDVQGKRLTERYLGNQGAFDFDDVPTNWTDLQLSRELDEPLRRKDIRQEVLLEFIRRTLRFLEDQRGISLNTLYRVRVPLERALRDKIERYRQKALESGFQMRLFGPEAAIETSYQYAFVLDPESYPASLHYTGGFQFAKHYYKGMVGEFDSKEELECAKALEMNPRIKRWVRNVKGMFSLPTSSGKFYPDFVGELDDGRILIVEYKGEHLILYEQEKKNVGELWESKSGGKALFLWAVKRDEFGRDVHRQLEDKIARRP